MLNQHTAAFEPKPRTSLQAHPHATVKPAAALNYFSLSLKTTFTSLSLKPQGQWHKLHQLRADLPGSRTTQPCRTRHCRCMRPTGPRALPKGIGQMNSSFCCCFFLQLIMLFLLAEGRKASACSLGFNKMAFGADPCATAAGTQLPQSHWRAAHPGGHTQHLQEPRNDPRSGFLFSAGSFAASEGEADYCP